MHLCAQPIVCEHQGHMHRQDDEGCKVFHSCAFNQDLDFYIAKDIVYEAWI